jgi:uroporphyrinogen decarboxylase
MDLNKVKERFGDRVCVVGNVDVDLLCRGTTEEIKSTTKELIRRVSPGGGHILSSGNTITSAVRGENFSAMLDTCREFGSYPIAKGR